MTASPDRKETHRDQPPRQRRLSFTAEQWVPFPVEQVFAFLADPHNLPRLMPRWQDACIDSLELHPPKRKDIPDTAGRGSRILLSFRPLPLSPIRLRWLALIDEFEAGHHFCDLQVIGPFAYWHHCHLVSAEDHGDSPGTRITDVVDYVWTARAANRAIDALGGRLQLHRLFRYRQRQLPRLLRQRSAPTGT